MTGISSDLRIQYSNGTGFILLSRQIFSFFVLMPMHFASFTSKTEYCFPSYSIYRGNLTQFIGTIRIGGNERYKIGMNILRKADVPILLK